MPHDPARCISCGGRRTDPTSGLAPPRPGKRQKKKQPREPFDALPVLKDIDGKPLKSYGDLGEGERRYSTPDEIAHRLVVLAQQEAERGGEK